MLTFTVAGVDVIVGKYLGPGDVLITYLPAAHILEFVFENAVLYWGGTMGYGTIRTLSDTSVRNCAGDIRELKPTVMVGVPQVWETVKKGIVSKVEAGGARVARRAGRVRRSSGLRPCAERRRWRRGRWPRRWPG